MLKEFKSPCDRVRDNKGLCGSGGWSILIMRDKKADFLRGRPRSV